MPNRTKILFILGSLLPISLCVAAGVGAYQILPWHIPHILLFHKDGFEVLIYVRFPPRPLIRDRRSSFSHLRRDTTRYLPQSTGGSRVNRRNGGRRTRRSDLDCANRGRFLGIWGVPVAAFAGGVLVTIGVWQIAQTQGRVLTVTLLLAGIALNSFAGAGIGLMTFLADEEQLRSLTFWLLGGFGGATWQVVAVTLPVATVGAVVLFALLVRSTP